jgi:2-polyprenyl-3-methyl-5-hydroxy-6-metoxy-1,4-benzoquinol methylase
MSNRMPMQHAQMIENATSRAEELLELIVCPLCQADFEVQRVESSSRCANGHVFPHIAGVPTLLPEDRGEDASSIARSFGHQWEQFDYTQDRTWGFDADERLRTFLEESGRARQWFEGRRVLDAGCGNGVLSFMISTLGCTVLATDVSPSVFAASERFGKSVHFAQSDLAQPAFRPGAFDLVYCSGVLHHTANTRRTLEQVVRAAAPGGAIYVWLYWRVPGMKSGVKRILRNAIRPLPDPVKRTLVVPFALQGWLRDRSLSLQEHRLVQHDFFTPRYRWEHTPEEVQTWFRELGFVNIVTQTTSKDGFGVLAERPPARASGDP